MEKRYICPVCGKTYATIDEVTDCLTKCAEKSKINELKEAENKIHAAFQKLSDAINDYNKISKYKRCDATLAFNEKEKQKDRTFNEKEKQKENPWGVRTTKINKDSVNKIKEEFNKAANFPKTNPEDALKLKKEDEELLKSVLEFFL